MTGTSATQLNQTIYSQKKSMHNRNGSTNNQPQQSMLTTHATPQRSSETLNSKLKKKVSREILNL